MPPFSFTAMPPESLRRESSFGVSAFETRRSEESLAPVPKPHYSMTECLPIVSPEKRMHHRFFLDVGNSPFTGLELG